MTHRIFTAETEGKKGTVGEHDMHSLVLDSLDGGGIKVIMRWDQGGVEGPGNITEMEQSIKITRKGAEQLCIKLFKYLYPDHKLDE